MAYRNKSFPTRFLSADRTVRSDFVEHTGFLSANRDKFWNLIVDNTMNSLAARHGDAGASKPRSIRILRERNEQVQAPPRLSNNLSNISPRWRLRCAANRP